jgi:hypothetical protein
MYVTSRLSSGLTPGTIKAEVYSGAVCGFQGSQNTALKVKSLKLISYKKKIVLHKNFLYGIISSWAKLGSSLMKAAWCASCPVTLHPEEAGQAPSHLG